MGFPEDKAALERYLDERIEGFKGPIVLSRFEGGQSNPTFLITTPGKRYVLRKKPDGILLKSAHAVDREFRITSALHGTDVPVAEPLCYCEDPQVIGAPFYVSRFIDGRVLWDPALPGMTPHERAAIYDEMNGVVAALHQIDYRAIGLTDFGRPDRYVERQLSRWTQQYRQSETQQINAMEHLIEWLPQHLPRTDESAIVHGDLRLDNLMFHPTEPRVLAVLDWELSTIGHPLADFGYHLMIYRMPRIGVAGMLGVDFAALNIPDEAQYVRMYCERTGRAGIDHLDFYLAFNMFRMAAIFHGIKGRFLRGTAASARAKEYASAVEPMAETGWKQAELAMKAAR